MSKKKTCYWSADGTHLPNVQPYAKIKHRILEDYIQSWIEVLAGHGTFGPRAVTLVDGFCGGGMYRDSDESGYWAGSPLRMIWKLEEGLNNVRLRKPWYELDIEFIFIDEQKEHADCLKKQLKEAGLEHYLATGKCKVLNGKFRKNLDYCLNRVKERGGHSFFFLDPFGLAVPPTIVREILELGRSEVLFTHMLSGLVRLLKQRDERYGTFFGKYEADEYYREIDEQSTPIERQAYLRDQGLNLFRTQGAAKFAWTFAIIPKRQAALYYLIHLSSNATALSVMRDTLWSYNNLDCRYHYGIYGLGHRTQDDIAENLDIFDIDQENLKFCFDELSEQLLEAVYDSEGTSFKDLYVSTMQKNPATREHYIELVNGLRQDGDIEVLRDGKQTGQYKIQNKDIIYRKSQKQLFLLDKEYRAKKTRSRKMQNSAPLPKVTELAQPDNQLGFLD